ncbi:hypothetical protein D3C72_1267340 [compost metagenome]
MADLVLALDRAVAEWGGTALVDTLRDLEPMARLHSVAQRVTVVLGGDRGHADDQFGFG